MTGQNRKIKILSIIPFLIGLLIFPPQASIADSPLQVEVWLDRGDGAVYYSGEAMTVYFKTNMPSYVTVYNIDSEGYVNILYPYYPGMDNFVAGGRTYAIPGGGFDLDLIVDEPVGIGYIEAVASQEPFYLDEWPFLSSTGQETAGVEVIRRVNGDPFLAIEDINQRILPFSEELVYSDDFAIYYVEEIVHYPRYLCSDCHVPTYYHYDPYGWVCPSYYIVVYDYWYYNDFYYWDYYYAYDYYDYYYRCYKPSPARHRYSRKYDYRVKEEGVYRTKGESTLGDGVIRVRGYAEKEATRHLGEEKRGGDEAITRSAGVPGPGAVPARKTIVDGDSYKSAPVASHKTAGADGENRTRDEAKTARSRVPVTDRTVKGTSDIRAPEVKDVGQARDTRGVERRTEGSERRSNVQPGSSARPAEKASNGGREDSAARRAGSVSNGRTDRHDSRPEDSSYRSSRVRSDASRSVAPGREERGSSRVSVRSENRISMKNSSQSMSRSGSQQRSSVSAPPRISNRGAARVGPSVRR